MSGSGVFDVSRLCDTVVMPARRIVGWMIALDSKSAWRAERANRAITGVCGMQWLGWLLKNASLVLRESDVEESRIALVGASAELFGGKAAGGRDSTPLPPPL